MKNAVIVLLMGLLFGLMVARGIEREQNRIMSQGNWEVHVYDADGDLDHIVEFKDLSGVADYIDLQSESNFSRFDVRNSEVFGESERKP